MSLPEYALPPPDEMGDHFARRVALAIAAATFLAAIVGFLQNQASAANTDASLRAQRLAIEATQSLVLGQERARVQVDTYALALEQRIRAANIGQQLTYAPESEAGLLRIDQERWLRIAERTEALSGIALDGPDGPIQDPTFPSRLLAGRSRDATRLEALQDAANEVGNRWSGQAAGYTAIIAIIAVALYLLGFSLTIELRRAKRLFAIVGVILVATAAGWTATSVAGTPSPAPDLAAEAYADGILALDTAYEQAGLQNAVLLLTRAIDLRPTFARAYVARANASFRLGSPQQAGFLSVVSDDALARSTADLARANDLGLGETAVLGDLGFQRFLQGLREKSSGRLDESIAWSRAAIARTDGDPVLHYNLAVALLAAGQRDPAREAYRQAVLRTVYVDVAARTRRDNPPIEVQYVAGALTDLGILEASRPDLRDQVAELRSYVIGSVARGEPGPAGAVGRSTRVDRLAADVFPSLVQWRADLFEFDSGAQTLSTFWYRRDPSGSDWAVLPEVSSIDVNPIENVDPTEGAYFNLTRYIGSVLPPQCLPAGTYRVELYVDGRPVGSAETSAAFGGYVAHAARDLGGAFCRPADWVVDPTGEFGKAAGYLGPARDRGVGLVHLQTPTWQGDPGDLSVQAMDGAANGLSDALPSRAIYDEQAGTESRYFMGLEGGRYRWYNYDGGYVRIAAGVDPAGGIFVAYVFGPRDWFENATEWQRIVESFSGFE